jgi:3-hydroxyisobutyrate dehydrogenase
MIAFLGAGLLGSGFVRAALRRGEQVQVWNRSADKAHALEAFGAKACASPEAAAMGADRVHVILSDDAAVDDVIARALPGLTKDALLIDHTTTSAHGAKARAERLLSQGIAFLHAPVFMGPQNALEATGVMLVSGDADRVERARSALAAMTGKLVYLGPDTDRAAKLKLLGNLFLMFMTAGVAEVMNLGKALELSPEESASLFDAFNPGVTLPARVKRVLEAEFDKPSWELQMARKDARLMLEEGERAAQPLAMLPAIAATMDAFLARGHAKDDWTVIAKDALSSTKK